MKRINLIFLSLLISIICLSCMDDKLTANVTYYPPKSVTTVAETTAVTERTSAAIEEAEIYITPSGKKYHYSSSCAGKNAVLSTLDEASELKKEPCKRCVK